MLVLVVKIKIRFLQDGEIPVLQNIDTNSIILNLSNLKITLLIILWG